MIWAIKDGARVRANPKDKALCPLCNEEVIAKCGSIKIWHWSHKSLKDCDDWYEPESKWHIEWKNEFPIEQQEVMVGKKDKYHIADIKNSKTVVELQNSSISTKDISQREKFYENMIWILNGNKFGENFILKDKGNYLTFYWKYSRKCWWSSKKPIYIDFALFVKRLKESIIKYENDEDTHQSPIYEIYEFYNEYIDEYMEGKKIVDYCDDTKQEIERLKEQVKLLENKLFLIKSIYPKTPCGGWGVLISKEDFLKQFKDG